MKTASPLPAAAKRRANALAQSVCRHSFQLCHERRTHVRSALARRHVRCMAAFTLSRFSNFE
jgi:hypothetical protein